MTMEMEMLRAKYDGLAKAVYYLRKYQKEFIEFKGTRALENSRRYAREVDNLLKKKIQEDKTLNQKSLFE